MKKILWILFGMTAVFFCGCTPRYVESGGLRCEALSESEEQELVRQARFLVCAIKKKLKTRDFKWMETHEPQIKIRYTGDRCGFARIRWQLPDKEIVVDFDGFFLTAKMHSEIYTRANPPELIDFSQKNPQKRIKR